ncbi:short chain dehydrogenase [Thermoplasmatales archaeon]|nr:short chain dehydrogenase [Thermoplasmatales archaeon]
MTMQSNGSRSEVMVDLVNYSRKLGSDENLVLHGGGNTSAKTEEIDHTGVKRRILRVKGSGSDLSTISEKGFTGLRLDDLVSAEKISVMSDESMADYLRKSMVDPSEPSPSVESFLHAFIPSRFVMHSHADSILSITNTDLQEDAVAGILGNVIVLPYIPPGFKLAKAILAIGKDAIGKVDGIVLSRHGLFTFSDSAEDAWNRHTKIVAAANRYIEKKVKSRFKPVFEPVPEAEVERIIPVIRGGVSRHSKKILNVDCSGLSREIALSIEGEKFSTAGPATPDMLIRTKYDYLYLESLENVAIQVEKFAKNYSEEYRKYVNGYPMHDPNPSIVVIRGYGIITCGITEKEARIIHDQALHTFIVNTNADTISHHSFISRQEAYDMEYWPLEEAKLRKFTPKKLQGSISLVTGAANGIGLESFRKLSENGSVVVACDVDRKIEEVAAEVTRKTGIASLAVIVNLSNVKEIRDMFRLIIRKYGGIDIIFNNAGILKSDRIEEVKIEDMDLHYAVIARGSFIITQEALKIMKAQNIGGNMVFNVTKNLLHPGPGMTSYGSAKAFAAHVCHYAAKEGGPFGIRSNIINPDKIFRGSKIWENGVLEARAKAKGQTVEEYKTQNLLKREVLPEHVANVLIALLDEDTFGATTDAMIPVDGGVV